MMQGQQVMDQQVADSLAQQAYVNQAVFPLHMFPHNVQQDITNALNSGNNELAQAEIQRFMQYAQVRCPQCHGGLTSSIRHGQNAMLSQSCCSTAL